MNISSVYVRTNAGLLDSLQSGSSVLFSVKGKGHNGLYTISIGGRVLNVSSSQSLVTGKRYRARLIKSGDGIELKILKEQNPIVNNDLASKVLGSFRLPLDSTLKGILAALMKSSFPVTAPVLKDMRRGSRIAGRDDPGFLRLLSILVDKKIPLTHDVVKFFESFVELSRKGDSGDPPDEENSRMWLENDRFGFNADLKKIVERDTEDTTRDSLLKYFNHRKGEEDNWFIIPLEDCCSTGYKGVLKLRLNKANAFKEFCLSLSGEASWEFIVKKKAETYSMEVLIPDSISKINLNSLFYNFKEKLRKKGMKFTDIIRETEFSDGFGGGGEYIHHSINKVV